MARRRGKFSWLICAGLLVAASAADAPLPPLTLPAPLGGEPVMASAGARVLDRAAAERAHDLGFPSIAADGYRELLAAPGADRTLLGLALATALLDAGRPAEAEAALADIPEPRGAAWRLRAGLAALFLRKRAEAQTQWDALRADELPEADRPWHAFLAGALWDTATPSDVTRANQFYRQAETTAATDVARARFQLAAEQVRLRAGSLPTEDALAQARDNAQRLSGRAIGYGFERLYAAMLAAAGREAEAVARLQGVLVAIPAQDRAARDELRFMLGLIGDRSRGGAGRNALLQLLENRQRPARAEEAAKMLERQRQALQLLGEASRTDPGRSALLTELDRLVAAQPPHPILENLLFTRAQFALSDKDYARAEADANALLRQFPLSPLRVHALVVLTQAAWEQQRFRLAADYARRARSDNGGAGAAALGRLRTDLGVLEAEASFRAEDFRNAADAIAAVLRDLRAELEPRRLAELMFLRVLAEIRSGSGEAARVLDELAQDPAFDAVSRWQAEWDLARALQLRGGAGAREAQVRVQALLAGPDPAALPADLRARMMWLSAQLAFDNGQSEETVRLAEALLAAPIEATPSVKGDVAGRALHLKARAEFALGRETEALETLRRLRAEHALSESAVASYLSEAEHYAAQDKIGEARRALIGLTDNNDYRASPYVPYALYRLALLSERLGSEENLREANRRIEELMEKAGADQELVFAARLKQGEIFTARNDLPAAQRAFEYVVTHFARRPDVVYAQLALAKCRNAQSASDPDRAHTAAAQLLFEQLRDRLDAPIDVRVEAGYNLGAILLREGKMAEAALVWWRDVVNDLFIEKPAASAGAKRLYWIGRTLCDLGEVYEKLGRLEEARRAYQLVLETKLPVGDAIARARLQQLGAPVARPGQ